jgi:hypothetical protein
MIHHVTSTLRDLPVPETLNIFALAERGGWRWSRAKPSDRHAARSASPLSPYKIITPFASRTYRTPKLGAWNRAM